MHHVTNSGIIASYNPPVTGSGLQDMNELGDALDEDAEEYSKKEYEPEFEESPPVNVFSTPDRNPTATRTSDAPHPYGSFVYNRDTGEMEEQK